ncbi:ATP-binding cassette domain-containing protein (plasmid) [Sinorhizobium meliloti]|uniref:ATP-binding cassette domain-containing protein n=1 Tax=Sinorhizobium TaxID=28105 RepID=UPI00119D5060|nr:ATP-binding cassette domain-containing protein [Sinorhizobium medicae]MDX0009840.1 ATP-binding cassette domain-containing protein [Sinorhizobium meliloti]MDX0227308.1 ATP-binding cassette domain-containing protein [Sinorhizobium meliloti]TWA26372.1 D-xylose transport system ATP-binding protein [Sinorhizobium medicae]
MNESPLLSLRAIKKSFGAVQVLLGVDLDVRAGEVTALVGDNGAGKSTLIKCLAGIHQPNAGEILWEGQPIRIPNPKAASAVGIEFVYQDLALCDNLDVVQNMFLGRERKRGPFLDQDSMEVAAREVLASLSVTTLKSVRQPVASLSGGQRQSIAVARSVMWNSKLVVLDEPTAALGVAQTQQVLALVRRLAERGLAVILVSHNLEDVLSVSDGIAVLRLGRMVTQVRREDVNSGQLVELITTGQIRGATPPADNHLNLRGEAH